MTPVVSVVLTTFNGATRGFLREAIESVLAQTESRFELLIVDDGSTDDTRAQCTGYSSDPRVRYIRKENGGLASARNAGIAEAAAELICFLDDDDLWLPQKLERQIARFESESPRPGLIYSAIQVVDASGRKLFVQYHPAPRNFFRGLFYENMVDAPSSVMLSAEALRTVGAFREDVFDRSLGCEDRELWMRIARKYSVVSIPEPLVCYRLHGQQMSTLQTNMERGELAMLAVALRDAPPEIAAENESIYRNLYTRFAYNRFTLSEYSEFRNHFHTARKHGSVGAGLWARYFLSFVPFAVTLLRRLGAGDAS